MTTAAPPCAPVTPSPGPLRRESQPTQCAYIGRWPSALAARPAYSVLNTEFWRGELRSPSNPCLSRRRRSTGRSGAAAPEPPAPVRAWRSGAPLWSPPTSRRRTRPPTARRRPSGSQTSGSGPTRPSATSESPGSPPWSASRTSRRPKNWPDAASTRPRAGSWPSRRDHSRQRRGLGTTPHPGTTGVTSAGFRGCRSVDRRGVVPSPALRPKSGERIRRQTAETQRGQRVSHAGRTASSASKYASKGGLTLSHAIATPRPAPKPAGYSRGSSRSRAWPGTPGQPAMTAERTPLPARMTRGDRPARPAPSASPRRASRWRRTRKPLCDAIRSRNCPPGAARGLEPRSSKRHTFPSRPTSTQGCPPFRMSCLTW